MNARSVEKEKPGTDKNAHARPDTSRSMAGAKSVILTPTTKTENASATSDSTETDSNARDATALADSALDLQKTNALYAQTSATHSTKESALETTHALSDSTSTITAKLADHALLTVLPVSLKMSAALASMALS